MPDGTLVQDDDWQQGDLGIYLNGLSFENYSSSYDIYPNAAVLPYSNICDNGQRDDYQNLMGRAQALQTAGAHAEPIPPAAFAPPAAPALHREQLPFSEPEFRFHHDSTIGFGGWHGADVAWV